MDEKTSTNGLDGRTWTIDIHTQGKKTATLVRVLAEWDRELLEDRQLDRLQDIMNRAFNDFAQDF